MGSVFQRLPVQLRERQLEKDGGTFPSCTPVSILLQWLLSSRSLSILNAQLWPRRGEQLHLELFELHIWTEAATLLASGGAQQHV